MLHYSREQELQSDCRGIDYAIAAGYDPREARNRVAQEPDRSAAFQRAIAGVYEGRALERDDPTATSEELMGVIRDLGYVSMAGALTEVPHPLEPSERPSPLSMRDDYRAMLQALKMANTGRSQEAERLLRDLLDEEDENHFVRNVLALALMQQQRFAEAMPYLREVIESGPQWPDTHTNLAVCLAETGDLEGAKRSFLDALALAPGKETAVDGLARVLRMQGLEDEALEVEASLR